jgi:hypothetical protein
MIAELESRESLKRLWWYHDSFWYAAVARELGIDLANRLNLKASEKAFRMLTITLLRKKMVKRPRNVQELMLVFRHVWKNAFFDDLYVDEPVEFDGTTATWIGSRCHAYDSLKRAHMLEGYECGCQGLRTGVMKALRLRPIHRIEESLVKGDARCVITLTYEPA